jgi:hypothetical protein
MNNLTELQKEGYKGLKVTSMIQALKNESIYKHLRLTQQDELSRVNNRFKRNGYISKSQMSFVWNLYWNFILNDFRFEDKSKEFTVITGITAISKMPKHIGMQMLLNINKE